ncbi:MAG TPA: DUF6048 family protein [Cyclobacteriaceae bacterium]
MLRYTISILLVAFAPQLNAQDRIEGDSSRLRFLPTGIRVGTDLLAIGKSMYTNYFKGWEVNVDADVYRRFYLTADYGSWKTNYALDNGVYSSDGRYLRVGLDINFLLKDTDRNMFFLGVRRGHTNYTDYSDYTYIDPFTSKAIDTHAGNSDASANWNELTTGLRVKLWKFVWLGATGRFKFGYNGHGQSSLISYDVPGYGKTIKNNWWGINYQIFVRIPVREDKHPLVLPK